MSRNTVNLMAIGWALYACLMAGMTQGATIDVCWDGGGDYTTIQAGIDAASNGDEVVICDGTYTGTGNKNLDFNGKAITVRSANGADDVTIDCEDDGQGFYFVDYETSTSVVDGLTITGASSPGIEVSWQSSPTIQNCVLTGNSSAGISYSGSGTISNCVMTNNTNTNSGNGGGLHLEGKGPFVVTDCVITNNTADGLGGGVKLMRNDWDSATEDYRSSFINCTISGNTAQDGGGAYGFHSLVEFINCAITDNTAERGGGIHHWTLYSTPGADMRLVNCLIAGNEATGSTHGYGGGIEVANPGLTMINCTITDNSALTAGGGVTAYVSTNRVLDVANTIIWGNTAPIAPNASLTGDQSSVTYCDIEGGFTGTGNIDQNPHFSDASEGDYRLGIGSPCIDAGDNSAVPSGITTDLDGEDRIVDGDLDSTATVDMGAYEAPPAECAIGNGFEAMPDWDSSYDASWGSAATWSIDDGGEAGDALYASRSSQGSSAKVSVYDIEASTNYAITVYMKCPSSTDTYWAEFAYRLGSYTASDFDSNPGNWTMVKKFSNGGDNGNGDTWVEYVQTFNSGSATELSIGYKQGATGGTGPTVGWDSLCILEDTTFVAENFESMPSWSSSYDASWGSAATWSIASGGESGDALSASRGSEGSSAKVKVYEISSGTDYTILCYMKCPSSSATYWAELAYRLGSYDAEDFDSNPGNWTMVKRFSNSGTNGNGDTWVEYTAPFNSSSATQISVGFKLGSQGSGGPTVAWDTLRIE